MLIKAHARQRAVTHGPGGCSRCPSSNRSPAAQHRPPFTATFKQITALNLEGVTALSSITQADRGRRGGRGRREQEHLVKCITFVDLESASCFFFFLMKHRKWKAKSLMCHTSLRPLIKVKSQIITSHLLNNVHNKYHLWLVR